MFELIEALLFCAVALGVVYLIHVINEEKSRPERLWDGLAISEEELRYQLKMLGHNVTERDVARWTDEEFDAAWSYVCAWRAGENDPAPMVPRHLARERGRA